jgi:HD-like signal output (HDOD) protein
MAKSFAEKLKEGIATVSKHRRKLAKTPGTLATIQAFAREADPDFQDLVETLSLTNALIKKRKRAATA